MIKNKLNNKYNKGISPVIGVILMVALTVSLVTFTTVIVYDMSEQNNDASTSQIAIDFEDTGSSISANVIRNDNTASIQVIKPDGNVDTFDADVGSTIPEYTDTGTYSFVAIHDDGSKQTIDTATISSDTNTLSGTAQLNPPIHNATVEAVDEDGTVINDTLTNDEGEYELYIENADNVDKILLESNEAIMYDGMKSSFTGERTNFSIDEDINFTFDEACFPYISIDMEEWCLYDTLYEE